MTTWQTVEATRHQVAIAGRVSDAETGKPIERARVEIVAGPAAFMDRLALHQQQQGQSWAAIAERPDRTMSRADGHFHFLDLSDGAYTLAISLPGSASRYGQRQVSASVSRNAAGDIAMALTDATLPPTTLRGQVSDAASGSPLALAQVRVNGSGEAVFSSIEGRYSLTALEAGSRTVTVQAQGHTTLTRQVILAAAGDSATLDFALA